MSISSDLNFTKNFAACQKPEIISTAMRATGLDNDGIQAAYTSDKEIHRIDNFAVT